MLSSGAVLQNRYCVIRHLSRGGMGAVYLVKHQRLGKTFALKETFFSDDDQLRKAFEREAQLLANLDHPVLPNVTDHFTEGESQYLLMEYIPGEDLGAQLVAQGKPFPPEKVLEWADQLLDALDYLHSNDPPIVHRDIKPENLKLTPRGTIVLLDFGLAKGATAEMSRMSRSVFGYTPNYAPLEQVQSEGTDARSDLYSLAATLYHLMTGQIPPRVTARIAAVADGQADPLRPANEVNPEVPAAVAAVLQQAMARNRNHRPESAAVMREALRIARQATLIETTPVETTLIKTTPAPPVTREEKPTRSPLPETLTDQQAKSPPALTAPSPTVKATEPKPIARASQPSALPTQRAIWPISPAEQELTLPSTSEPPTRRGLLWFGVAAFVVIIGLVIAASMGLFSGKKGTTSSKTGNVEASNTSGASNTSNRVDATPGTTSTPQITKAVNEPRAGTPLRNQIGMEFVYVPAGMFMMGSDRTDDGKSTPQNEKPVHQVTFQSGFYMDKYEVTQAQWRRVTGLTMRQQRTKSDPSDQMYGEGDNRPIYYLSWNDVQDFINRLNALNDGYQYRLPSEAEWEYACRAGTTGDYAGDLNAMAWYGYGSPHEMGFGAHPVGQKQPNAWGLYDMHGNLSEWCEDPWHDDYNGAPTDGSAWLSGGDSTNRVLRGGSWAYNSPSELRSASRSKHATDNRNFYYGIRVVAVARNQ